MDIQQLQNPHLLEGMLYDKLSIEAILLFDENLLCIDVNDFTIDLFKYSREELIGSDLTFLVVEQDLPLIQSNVQKPKSEPYEVRMVCKDKSQFLGLIQGFNIIVNGKKLRIATCRDITQVNALRAESDRHRRQLESIFKNSISGIFVTNKNREVIQANKVAANIVGWEKGEDIIGKNMDSFHLSLKHSQEFSLINYPALLKNRRLNREVQAVKKDGSTIWVRVSGSLIDNSDNPTLDDGVVWVIDDISQIKEAERKLQSAYNELEIIFNNAMIGILVVGAGRVIYKANQTMADIMGYDSPQELVGHSARILHVSDESYTKFGQEFYYSLVNREVTEVDYQIQTKHGKKIWASISGRAIDTFTPVDLDKGSIWVFRDISLQKKMEKKLLAYSRKDSLTQLYNRRYFIEKCKKAFNKKPLPLALLMIDLDRFKKVNDSHGHHIGDKALRFFAKVCKEVIGTKHIIGRLGGEEFAMLLIDTDLQKAEKIATELLSGFQSGTQQNESLPTMTASIGLVAVQQGEKFSIALKRADKLLYRAKSGGRNRVEVG